MMAADEVAAARLVQRPQVWGSIRNPVDPPAALNLL